MDKRKIDEFYKKTLNQIYREDFYAFFRDIAFPAIFPNRELKEAKSTLILCAVAQAVSLGKDGWKKVIVNIPPGLMKSTILSAGLPAWTIGRKSSERIFGVSNTDELSKRNTAWTKQIMKSPRYQEVFPNITLIKDTETHFKTVEGGEKQGFSTLGNITGQRCDLLIPDDYMSFNMILSQAENERALKQWDGGLYSRIDKINGRILIVEQRLDIKDLTGYIKRTRPDEFKIISIPAYFEKETIIDIDGKEFYFAENELLSPEYLPQHEIDSLKNRVVDPETKIANGKQVFLAQYMQNPIADGGNMVDIEWFQNCKLSDIPAMQFDMVAVSVDSAQKPNEVNDPSAFLKFGIKGNYKYLIDIYCERKVYPETKENLIAFCHRGHKATHLIIEDANTGSSLLQELPNDNRMRGVNIVPISHGGIKKEIRFLTSTGSYADKSYFFCKDASWYPAFESELLQFPKGSHDDMVDCLSQFAKWHTDFTSMLDYWCMVV